MDASSKEYCLEIHPELQPKALELERTSFEKFASSESQRLNTQLKSMAKDVPDFFSLKMNGFLASLFYSYHNHLPLRLSPDHVWIAVLQGISAHVNQNSEQLRKKLVAFEGKRDLVAVFPDWHDLPEEWEASFAKFSELIPENILKEARPLIGPSFSTTGDIERHVTNLTVMDFFKQFFNYIIMAGCGVPRVTLTGSAEDWKTLRAAAQKLMDYVEMGWWGEFILPVLDEFVLAREGKLNVKFWDCVYKPVPRSISGMLYYSDINERTLAGWMVNFCPYVGRGNQSELCKNERMLTLSEIYRVHDEISSKITNDKPPRELLQQLGESLKYGAGVDMLPDGQSSVDIRFINLLTKGDFMVLSRSGFVGVEVKKETSEISPVLAWFVGKKLDEEKQDA